jgi:hypothetical protein
MCPSLTEQVCSTTTFLKKFLIHLFRALDAVPSAGAQRVTYSWNSCHCIMFTTNIRHQLKLEYDNEEILKNRIWSYFGLLTIRTNKKKLNMLVKYPNIPKYTLSSVDFLTAMHSN